MAKLSEMIAEAAAADQPWIVEELSIAHSAIDPCGLRETNFDMMNTVADGLNNVARHIRPFTLVTWAWRRALKIAEQEQKATLDVLELEDFVSRIEVIFAWSNFLVDRNVALPGAQALTPLIASDEYTFGGPQWQALDKVRRYSTSLSAPINYGPGLKSLGWVVRNASNSRVLVPAPGTGPALDAFEARIADRLDHPAFSSFGTVTVTAEEVRQWADAWSLDSLTEEERLHAARSLCGELATPTRRRGLGYLLEAAKAAGTADIATVRNVAAGETDIYLPDVSELETAGKWKRLQHRQLFRFSVESLLAWILDALAEGPCESEELTKSFIEQAGIDPSISGAEALRDLADRDEPTSQISSEIVKALDHPFREGLARAVARGLAQSLSNAPTETESYDREDRLPLRLAARQARAKSELPAGELFRHILESWTLAQHVYWAVGRGLQDARRGGKAILRLKVVMDEGGWSALPGRGRLHPNPTADRIGTALSLGLECGLIASK